MNIDVKVLTVMNELMYDKDIAWVIKNVCRCNDNVMVLRLPLIVPTKWFYGCDPLLAGVAINANHRSWFMYQPIVWRFYQLLPKDILMIAASYALVNDKHIRYVGIANSSRSLWKSLMLNLNGIISTVSKSLRKGSKLTLTICCKEIYENIVDMCCFEPHVAKLLKGCYGNISALQTVLGILSKNCLPSNKKIFRSSFNETFDRFFDLFASVDKATAFYGFGSKVKLFAQLEAIKLCTVDLFRFNMFKKLISLELDVNKFIKLLWGITRSIGVIKSLKRLRDNFKHFENLTIYHSCYFDRLVSDNVVVFGQLENESATCATIESCAIDDDIITTATMASCTVTT